MKRAIYPRLAADGIRRNKQLYVPYILTCVGMVAMYYIMAFLTDCKALSEMSGGTPLRDILNLGSWVVAIFAVVFLIYTNSFLMRRRKKEFGLYNVLGLDKRNISRVLVWESVYVALLALSAGLLLGVALSKLCEMGLVRMLQGKVSFDLSISRHSVIMTVALFGAIFLFLLLNAIRQVKFSNTLALLHSENAGEKPPKGNWLLCLLGIALLGTAYYLAVSIEDPLETMEVFFGAVVLVIVGTYLLMIAGSVRMCRILQRRKRYYYDPKHFVSVSSMVYRMKRNGAGLASICILATMVLVMLSSTSSLYFGQESILRLRYPRQINFVIADRPERLQQSEDTVLQIIERKTRAAGVERSNEWMYRMVQFDGFVQGNRVTAERKATMQNEVKRTYFCVICVEDFNRLTGESVTLAPGQAMVQPYRMDFPYDSIHFAQGAQYAVVRVLKEPELAVDGDALAGFTPTLTLVVPQLEEVNGMAPEQHLGDRWQWRYGFDTELDAQAQADLAMDIRAEVRELSVGSDMASTISSRAKERIHFYTLYGGLFFIGIMLSILFTCAAVLVIYYKQVSEGYEDQARFEVMQKVGMTRREIRRSINSQMLTVFALPLLGAGTHMAFAFPMISKLLLLFNLWDTRVFAIACAACLAMFAVFYIAVYRITSNVYCRIVGGARA